MTAPSPSTLGALKSEAWRAIRRFNETGDPADADRASAAAWDVEAACEQYRAAHYPTAEKLFVVCDAEIGQPLSVYVVTTTGIDCIYDAERVSA